MTKGVGEKSAKPAAKRVSPSVRQNPGAQIVAAPQRQSNALASSEDVRFAEVVTLIEVPRRRAYRHLEKVSPLVTQLPCTLAADGART